MPELSLRIPQVNEVRIAGRLMMDPVKVDNGPVRCRIASDRYYRDKNNEKQKQTAMVWVEAWGDLGDRILSDCHKADPVLIDGELVTFAGTLKDGHKFEDVKIRVQRLQKLSWHQGAHEANETTTAAAAQTQAADDDIPF